MGGVGPKRPPCFSNYNVAVAGAQLGRQADYEADFHSGCTTIDRQSCDCLSLSPTRTVQQGQAAFPRISPVTQRTKEMNFLDVRHVEDCCLLRCATPQSDKSAPTVSATALVTESPRSSRNVATIRHPTYPEGGTRWRSWWRHCATSRKVTSSIPDGVIGIFH